MQPETAHRRPPGPWPFDPVPEAERPDDAARHDPPPLASSGSGPGATDTDALVARLRSRRSAAGVAAAYAAAHGHPADPRSEQGARRWALRGPTAVVAVVAVLLLGLGVAVLALRGDGVVPLAPAAADGTSPGGSPAPSVPVPLGTPRTDDGPGPGAPDAAAAGLLVHVVGAVHEPGLVTVPDGARVADALEAAGGVTGEADLTAVNLARAVVDGEQLYVPLPGEAVPVPPGAAPGAAAAGPDARGTVDINTADAAALEALPGVGPAIAQAIVEWRAANGPFASVDELEDVPGIGPSTLEKMRDSAQVGP